jgi:hypothetical protein
MDALRSHRATSRKDAFSAQCVRAFAALQHSASSRERFTGSVLFGDRKVQIQECSPGRLNARRSALLGIGFYLGAETLRRVLCFLRNRWRSRWTTRKSFAPNPARGLSISRKGIPNPAVVPPVR